MAQKASAARPETLPIDPPKAPSLWGFRRRSAAQPTPAPAPAAEDSGFAGFESFGRGGMELGGLHRDQQWVGAWGGRC
jgi:hypothetical protein